MLNTVIFTGKIELLSGLHIGGNKDSMHIGGIDNPVIKNPITNLPYIPGSSLKGKIRFLLEHYFNLADKEGGKIPSYSPENKVALIFGHTNHDRYPDCLPTRVIFHDGNLLGAISNDGSIDEDIEAIKQRMLSDFVEAKTEVVIDRLTGTARGGGLRTIERVPAGVVFDFMLSLRVFVNEERAEHVDIIKKGLSLLENDALGGSGSRGSGRIKFRDMKIDGEPFELKSDQL
jgi:CRISPR-associated protein Csm3